MDAGGRMAGPPAAGEGADRYEALFGSEAFERELEAEAAAPPAEGSQNVWRRLADHPHYETANLVATYIAVFFAPLAAGLEIAVGAPAASLEVSAAAAKWVEGAAAVFFLLDTLVGLLAFGAAYLRTPACWINVLAVGATGLSLTAGGVGIANPRVLRILRTVRAVAKVGLVQKVGTKETVLGAEMLRSMSRDDAWFAIGMLLLVSMLGDFSIGQYEHWSDPILEVIIYGGLVLAVRWKAERNVERVGKVFMDRLSEANELIRAKMREIPGLEDSDRLIAERAEEAARQGRNLNEIDTLVEAIRMIISNLRRFISRRAFLEAKGERVIPTRSPVALMFTDVAGFSEVTRKLDKQVLPVLQTYLGAMNKEVMQAGGDIDKFLGEGIFAYFHDGAHPTLAANAAFDAAIGMYRSGEALAEAEAVWDELFADRPELERFRRFETRFGLHWGAVITGPIGSEERADSTLIGDNVDIAARLEALNDIYGTRLLVSQAFFERVSADRRVACRRVDRISIPEASEAVFDLYTIDPEPLPVAFISLFDRGLAHYLEGDWTAARGDLEMARSALDDAGRAADGATEALVARIDATNAFWRKALRHLRERVPDRFTERAADELAGAFEGGRFLPPATWRGHWRHDG